MSNLTSQFCMNALQMKLTKVPCFGSEKWFSHDWFHPLDAATCVVQSFNVVLFWDTWYLRDDTFNGAGNTFVMLPVHPLVRRSRLKLQGSNLPARMAPARTWKTCFGQRWKPQLCSHRLKFLCWFSLLMEWLFSKMFFGKAVGKAKDEGSFTQILIGQFLVEQDYRRVWKVAIQAWQPLALFWLITWHCFFGQF